VTEAGSPAIRPYRPADEHGLVELFRNVYGREISADYWRWKLQRSAFAGDNVWLATAGERPVFQYGGIPTRFQLQQRSASIMVAVDAMTAPEFRRRGLLTAVVSRAHAAWREHDVAFVIGLPNQQWGSRTQALGWLPLLQLQWLLRPLHPEATLARRLKLPLLKHLTFPTGVWNRLLQRQLRRDPGVRTESVRQADDSFDRLWDRCKSDWMFSTVRDRDWVNWRFLSSPARAYELTLARRAGEPVGYSAHCLVGTSERPIAHLAELFSGEGDDVGRAALLFDLVNKLLPLGVESLRTLAVPGTRQHHWLRKAGFFAGPSFSVQIVPLAPDLPLEPMREARHWNLSGADFDVI
jgi:Acetyltransferase (GNAT) domain